MSSQPDDLFARLASAGNNAEALVPVLAEIAALAATPHSFDFNHCIDVIAQSPAVVSVALCTWLVGPAVSIDAANALLNELSVTHLAGEDLAVFEPARVGSAEAVLTAFRLAALDAAPAVVLGWIAACLTADVEPGGQQLVALLHYQLQQFPRTTTRLLANLEPDLMTRYPAAEQLREAWAQSIAARDAAPRLKELRLSAGNRDIVRRHRLREQRSIHQQAEEASVMMQFVTRAHFKYAREVALPFEAGGITTEQTLTMQEHELTLELPFLAMSDPLGNSSRRRRLLRGST